MCVLVINGYQQHLYIESYQSLQNVLYLALFLRCLGSNECNRHNAIA